MLGLTMATVLLNLSGAGALLTMPRMPDRIDGHIPFGECRRVCDGDFNVAK
jgi:hypothetical protein